jgi:AAA domain-containing protein
MSVADDLKTMTPKDAAKQRERLKREIRRELDAEERAPTSTPELLTLRERLGRPRAIVPWRIAQLQAVGHRVLLAAQFKAGKTTLAANVARSVLDGDAFLDTYDTVAIDGVLALVDFEMSATQLDDWYEAQRISNDNRLLVIPLRGAASSFDITNQDVRAHWVAVLKTRHVRYLILDCLRPVLDALGLNEHMEAGLFLTALDALLRDAEIPEALVIQHMGHKNERARGDSRLLDWPDVGWTLVREGDDDPASPRFLKAYGRDVDVPEMQLAYDALTRRLSVIGADEGGVSRASAKVAAALADICAFVAHADAPQSSKSIEDAVKVHDHRRDAIRKALQKAVESGALIAVEGGRGGGCKYRSSMAERPDWIPELNANSASPPKSARTPPAE